MLLLYIFFCGPQKNVMYGIYYEKHREVNFNDIYINVMIIQVYLRKLDYGQADR